MSIKLISKHNKKVEYHNVPDCWHAYQWLQENGNPKMGSGETLADMVLECWHQAHDYKDAIEGRASVIAEEIDITDLELPVEEEAATVAAILAAPEIDEIPDRVLPTEWIDQITKARSDLHIEWDEAVYEEATMEWVVPCEANFTGEGIHWGNLLIEQPTGATAATRRVDYYLGDLTAGPHPDLHCFER